jgi:hypothetical protein
LIMKMIVFQHRHGRVNSARCPLRPSPLVDRWLRCARTTAAGCPGY